MFLRSGLIFMLGGAPKAHEVYCVTITGTRLKNHDEKPCNIQLTAWKQIIWYKLGWDLVRRNNFGNLLGNDGNSFHLL